MVFPGMVYISHPTEYGTLYTRGELAELSDICQQYHIPLYLDGARLGYGLAVEDTDVTMEDIAEYCGIPLSTLSDLLKKFEEIANPTALFKINGKKVSKQKYNAEMKKIEKKYPLKQIWSFDTFELTTDNINNLVKNYKSFIITGKKF